MRFEPRGRALLIIGAGILVTAYAFSRSELLSVASLLIGLPCFALLTVRLGRRRQRIEISRTFVPAVAEAGRPVAVSVDVRNPASSRTVEATWRDTWPWSPYSDEPARLPPLARNRGRFGTDPVNLNFVLEPPRRGVFDIGPFVVDVRDPFHLVRSETRVGGTQKLLVTPRVVALPVTGLAMEADDGSAGTRHQLKNVGGDDIMTREYRHGDALRRVHWKATARRGELTVRLEEQHSRAHASIVLDTRRNGYHDAVPATPGEPQSDSFEWSLAFTASLALHLRRAGFSVDVVETGFRQLAAPVHQEAFLESLAAATLVEAPTSRRALSLVPETGQSVGSIFAVVADAETSTVESLVSQRARFGTALAFVVNPRNDLTIGLLRDAGWMCVAVRPTDDLAAVWVAAAELREAHGAGE